MSGSPHVGRETCEERMRSFWLPPHSRGNGLDADRWAEIVAVAEDAVGPLLDALRAAGVPARAAPAPAPTPSRLGRPVPVYVAPDRYAQAENILLHLQVGGSGPTG